MNISQIEENVKSLIKKIDKESFIYDMLLAYGTPKATITRAKNGSKNLSKNENEIVIKKKVFFAHFDKDIDQEFERLSKDSSTQKHDPRFVIVTDYKIVKALDTKLDDKLEFPIKEFNKKFDFFLPLAGIEKKEFKHENPVDVKAAEKLAKLFDLIKKDNPKSDPKSLHSLNVFLTRLLFCYFAEDTDIFPQGLFTDSVGSHTQNDGSDISEYLFKVFEVMNLEKRPKNTPDYLNKFPYVNGGLFAESHSVPKFTKKSREALLDIGDLNWAEINPDIFGSMIQAVVHPDQRAGLGMHYTSVTNIMKVIEPLFLRELYEEFDGCKGNKTKLKKLLARLSNVKVFDPACGSGNFLIIAYKELRILEIKVLKDLNEMPLTGIQLNNFFGIELDDFAHEVAMLSLWLVKHQMDQYFKQEFGSIPSPLPLKKGGNIVCGNAVTMDWNSVCENDGHKDLYVCGNPPYLGQRNHQKEHIADMEIVFKGLDNYKNLDYISCWFINASRYIKNNQKFAFVTTSSICQGSQVDMLWPKVFAYSTEIFFAYEFFKWSNYATNNAGVMCSIIGLRKECKGKKFIFTKDSRVEVKNINAYLVDGPNIIVSSQKKSISGLMPMIGGNQPREGGYLCLTDIEKRELVASEPAAQKYIKKLVGTNELLKSIPRWCIWIEDSEIEDALRIKEISRRVKLVRDKRKNGNTVEINFVNMPHRFVQVNRGTHCEIVIPNVSTERREYIPIGFVGNDTVVTNLAMQISDGDLFTFGIINSKMHMAWVRAVSGRLGNAIRYTVGLSYNTFPFPNISRKTRDSIEKLASEILKVREKHSDKTLETIYDPDKMPVDLKSAHQRLDEFIDTIYSSRAFNGDQDRLNILFKLYEELAR